MAKPEVSTPRGAHRLLAVLAIAAAWTGLQTPEPANAAVTLLGVQYQQDDPFSEYQCYYNDKNYPTSCSVSLLGANAHVFIKNEGTSAVTLDDVNFAGYGLVYALREKALGDHICNSLWFRWWPTLPQDIVAAGEPAWYKMDPASIPAGGVGQVIVRLRRIPTTATLALGVDTSANTLNATLIVDPDAPELASIGYSQDLTKAYLYWRRTGGAAPVTVMMDGIDVSPITTTVGDAFTNYAVSVISLPSALIEMSYHVYQGIYSDAETATGGIRTWVNPFIYCSWAAFETDNVTEARAWMDTCQDRGLNTLEMNSASSGLMNYFGTGEGKAYADSHNYGFIKDDNNWGHWSNNPRMWYIDEEPDGEEAKVVQNFCGGQYQFPCFSNQAGTMGMHHIDRGEELRAIKNRPTTIDMNGSWKPWSWYAYGQLSDALEVNNYLQPHTRKAYDSDPDDECGHPGSLPLYDSAMAIYATALAGARAAEPNPFRQLLHSCQLNVSCDLPQWDWAHPKCKRLEAYYALAAGAKGLGYWWFKKNPSASNGLGDDNLQAQDPALWEEIGLIGAETKFLGPYLVSSHPVDADVVGSTNVWVKTLAWGTGSLILFIVNDNYWLDEDYHNTPIASATVTLGLPAWMLSSPMAFEVGRTGLGNVATSRNGNNLILSLGTLDVAKIVFVTVDPQLRMTLQQRYDTTVWPGICNFAPSVCSSNTSPPTIVVQPSNKSGPAGGSATFAVTANGGSPFSFQWQKNGSTLTDGGHYSGCNTFALTVSSVSSSDEGAYRCVVTNPYGSVVTNAAMLAISTVTITQQPSAQYACPGSSAQFTVAATGQGTLTYQWQKDQVDLTNGGHYSGCTTATLTVSNAGSSEEGNYRCAVTDNSGTAYSNEAALTIQAGVTITQQPSSQLVVAGGTAQLTVAAAGSGTLLYQWQKNQVNLSDGGHYSGCTTATLTVSNADDNDVGGYHCLVTDDCSSTNSNEAELTIDTCGIAIIFQNGDFENWPSGSVAPNWTGAYNEAVAGQFVRSTSIVRGGALAQGVRARDAVGAWAHVYQGFDTNVGDALTILAYAYPTAASSGVNPQVGVNTSSARPSSWLYTLSSFTKNTWSAIGPLTHKATGTTTCLFLDVKRVGPVDTTTYWDDISVYHAHVPPGPAVANPTSTSLDVNVSPGCNVTNPSAECAISIGGGAYTLGTHWVQTDGTVAAGPIWQTDAAWGTRTVSGLVTDTTYTFKVKARYSSTYTQETNLGPGVDGTTGSGTPAQPTITQHPAPQSVCPGGTAVFSVAATGDAPLSYQWQKNSSDLGDGGHCSGVTTATLTVSNADAGDAAGYRCVIGNGAGTATSNPASLTLKAATAVTQHPQSQSVAAGDTAVLTVAGMGEGTLGYQWQKDSVNLSDGGHYSGVTTDTLTVSAADSSDAGDYRCVITGGCGGATSNQAMLTVGPLPVPGDFDGDGDVDQEDFGVLQRCLATPLPPIEPGCPDADLNKDGVSSINQLDLAVFLQCLSGPEIPGDPDCAN